jgi:hypothetical protein
MKFFSIAAVLALSGQAVAPISMANDASRTQYNTPSYGYATCHYKQLTGYSGQPLRIRVVVSGMCPYTIKYDPTTGTWTR